MAWLLQERNYLPWEPKDLGLHPDGQRSLAPSQQTWLGFIASWPYSFKFQKGASALLVPVQVGVEKREESFQSYTSKELELLEEMWLSQPHHHWIDLGCPGCLVKLIVIALALQQVNVSIIFYCYFLVRLSYFAFLLSLLAFLRNMEKAAGGFQSTQGISWNKRSFTGKAEGAANWEA